jgi:15-cis-phytoene desaturase
MPSTATTKRAEAPRATHADVVVVGGGLAGLACGVALCDSGLRVVLLEASDNLGGRARSWTDAATGDVIDIGPHVLLSEYPNMLALLTMLGTRDSVHWQTGKLLRLIDDRRAIDMYQRPLTPPLHLLPSIAKIGALSLRDKASNRRITWFAMQLTQDDFIALDDMTAMQLLRRYGVTQRFIEWFWASVCMSILNAPLEKCSAGALMRVYSQLIGRRGYRFGFAGGGLAELYAPAARRFMDERGGDIRLRARASSLIEQDGAIRGVALENGARIHAPHCVLAIPPADLAQIASPALARSGCTQLARWFEPCPYISVYLWLDRKLSQEKFWYRLWRPGHLNCDFYDLSNIRSQWRDRPALVASNIIYSHRAHDLSDAAIVAATHRELSLAVPAANDAAIVHAVVNRIPMAIVCPTPGFEARRPAAAALPGLLLAGDWTRTDLPSCMESAVRSGWLAADQILAQRGRPRSYARSLNPPQGLAGLVQRWAERRSL